MQHPVHPLSGARQPHALAQAGCWSLRPGTALRLQARHAAELHLAEGHAWVTLGGPYTGPANDRGDVFLRPGQHLPVPAGARLVMEPVGRAGGQVVRFDWRAPAVAPQASRFRGEVVAPAQDLGRALGQAGFALLRLLRGLLGFGEYLVAGRGRVLSPLEGNPP